MDYQEFLKSYQKVPFEEYANSVADKPVVSVCVMTYNHVNYIKACLDGILMQETDFAFEILVGEDDSTDGTREICIEYAKRYPEKIKLFLHRRENNMVIGGRPTGRFNFMNNLYAAKGRYIAMCEGDDYWTNANKLQKQVDFLEEHKDYALSFHEVLVRSNEPSKDGLLLCRNLKKKTYELGDFAVGNFIPTCSVVFYRQQIPPIDYLANFMVGDWPLFWYLLRNHKKAYFFKEAMAAYRKHDGGINSSLSKIKACSIAIDTLEKLRVKVPKDKQIMNKAILRFRSTILRQLINVDRVENQSKINTVLKDILSIWGGWSSIHFQIKALILVKFSWLLRIRGSQASL